MRAGDPLRPDNRPLGNLIGGRPVRGDRYHAWATRHVLAARQQRRKITVPEAAVGEAFTKLRYDRRVSPRKDASVALTIFKLVAGTPHLFELRPSGRGAHRRARDILTQYLDQSFSYVDALVFAPVDDDPALSQILTVDGRDFSSYRFAHTVEIVVP